MKLYISSLETHLPLDDSFVSMLAFEDVKYYARIRKCLYDVVNGNEAEFQAAFIDDKEKIIQISSKAELIVDPLLIDYGSKRIQNALITKLKNELNNDIDKKLHIEEKLNEIQDELISLLDDFDLPLQVDDCSDASKLVKSFGISIDPYSGNMSSLELLEKYLSIVQELNNEVYHVFFGLTHLLSKDELELFCKTALQRQVKVILIDHIYEPINESSYLASMFVDSDFDETFYPVVLHENLDSQLD